MFLLVSPETRNAPWFWRPLSSHRVYTRGTPACEYGAPGVPAGLPARPFHEPIDLVTLELSVLGPQCFHVGMFLSLCGVHTLWLSVKCFLGILPPLEASGVLCAWTHSCGWKECEVFTSQFLQLSWAGGSCWNSTICWSSRSGLTPLLTKWIPSLQFWNIPLVRSGSKTLEGTCSYFPLMFLCKNI